MRTVLACTAALAGAALLFGAPVAAGGTTNCTGPQGAVTINGNVSAGPGCVLNGTHVTGNVSVKSNGSLTATNATIDGNVEIQNNSGTNSICGTTIGGNLDIHNNSGTTTLNGSCGDNTVGGNVHVHNNSGAVVVSDTHIAGNLNCHNDSPGASTGTGGNTVQGRTQGDECTTRLTIDCPATGCSASTSDGNTDVTVNVPGGGNSGKLTIILSAPPADDGCGEGEGGPLPPSGSLVTVDPPSGYGPDNPIELIITYNFNEFTFQMCKSNDGGKTFFSLPMCTFSSEEDSTPDNVPCWLEGGEGPDAFVFITSNDPAVNGHS